MLSKRLVSTAAICLLLGAGTAACGDNKDSDKAAAPATTAAAAATPTATPTPTVAKLDTDKLSAQELEQKAKDALAGATALRISGTMADADGKMEMDLSMDKKGQCLGTVTLPGMGKIDIIGDGKASYLKGDPTFLAAMAGQTGDKNGAQVAELLKGRYLTGFDSDPQMKMMTSFCSLSDFSKQIVDGKTDKAEKGVAGNVNGVKTFSLKVTDSSGEQSTLQIATEGKPYLVQVETVSAKDGNTTINFSDFDKPLTVQAPPADNVIDFSKFKAQVKGA
ncbi:MULTISPECIES: hypothetical protein [Kitasatospora]|uniref:Lipoprotein n=1 Tax=Kitasatospora cathayae TaxID=3004092 RepID=A0ABY7Q4C1_9ACTN|nr:hypothetical protein [Kitasatospora sp. HUAS 3-15]WBP87571.1 hypothetical protein O1G21_18150 [Kitasatospora sp. HUAS 3-15]